jgi:tetratricopeptide (TPR) repeat protein
MSSIIEGYNYDIFISYRLRDNKGEKWVSEFVEALRTELESTIKEDISIYYDENPHDGLLETHDVDASLREKLKCLIFIPIISRIYCDDKAFAWVHEFKPFIEIASKDQFGFKITLPNGNVSTRVLPIKIHELDREDIDLCESQLGSVLRGVDFIYKSPGVNRPLRVNEDHPKDNLNKTYYRDQINKVANAIKDILTGLRYSTAQPEKKSSDHLRINASGIFVINNKIRKTFSGVKLRRSLISLIVLLVVLTSGFFTYKSISIGNNDKSIAIKLWDVPNDSSINEAANEFNIIINQGLTAIKKITIVPGFQTNRYFENEKSTGNIRRGLRANYFLSGNLRKKNKDITIWLELSETRNNSVLWNKSVQWTNELMSKNSKEILKYVAESMNVKLTPEEEKQIDMDLSNNPSENMKILTANKELNDAWDYYNYGDKVLDSASFKTAIESYNNIIKNNPSSLAYAKRAMARSWGIYLAELDSSNIELCKNDIASAKAIGKNLSNKDLAEIDIAEGFYYYYCFDENEKALDFFAKAAEEDPGSYKPLFYQALAYRRLGNWDECMRLIDKVIKMNPREALFLTNIGMTYAIMHKFDSAIIFHQRAIDIIPSWSAGYKNKFDAMIYKNGLTSEARNLIEEAIEKTGNKMTEYRIRLKIYEKDYPEALAIASKSDPADFEVTGNKYIYLAIISTALKNSINTLKYYDSARVDLTRILEKNPKNYFSHILLGLAYAGLGDRKNAIDEAEKSINLAHAVNCSDENEAKLIFAQIHVTLGNYEDAYSKVAFLLKNPSYFSKKLLQLDPIWKPLIDQRDFKKRIK